MKAEQGQGWEETDISDTLNIFDSTELRTPILIVEVKEMKEVFEIGNGQTCNTDLHQVSGSLDCMHDQKAVLIGGGEEMSENRMIVRRLTPKECERLQGFPDDWTDIGEWTDSKGKKRQSSDGYRYRALGNSLALPFWDWLAGNIADELRRSGLENPTMGSLFDGIGGFPLVFQNHGVKPIWASEIEEFPIAVTKRHFPEEGEDQ